MERQEIRSSRINAKTLLGVLLVSLGTLLAQGCAPSGSIDTKAAATKVIPKTSPQVQETPTVTFSFADASNPQEFAAWLKSGVLADATEKAIGNGSHVILVPKGEEVGRIDWAFLDELVSFWKGLAEGQKQYVDGDLVFSPVVPPSHKIVFFNRSTGIPNDLLRYHESSYITADGGLCSMINLGRKSSFEDLALQAQAMCLAYNYQTPNVDARCNVWKFSAVLGWNLIPRDDAISGFEELGTTDLDPEVTGTEKPYSYRFLEDVYDHFASRRRGVQ